MMSSPQRAVLTFNDFDDTAVVLPHPSDPNQKKRIKNAQLFLPILLWQTLFPNQYVGILTNRTKAESEILENPGYDKTRDYLVSEFIEEVKRMGIIIPEEHVIFGGEFRGEKEASLSVLAHARDILARQLESDSLDATIKAHIEQNIEDYDKSLKALYAGKNYFIRKFLDEHLDSDVYTFVGGQCAKADLTTVMLDDLSSITDICAAAGYIGIKAARGGKVPTEDSASASAVVFDDDYFSDTYFMALANTIGLADYARSLVKNPEAHADDLSMIKISALLFAWHSEPDSVSIEHFLPFEDLLDEKECEQLSYMMYYMQEHANMHPKAHYNSVDKLHDIFQSWADLKFLDNVLLRYQSQKCALAREKSASPSASMPELPDLPKSRSFVLGRKSKAKSEQARQRPAELMVSRRVLELEDSLKAIEEKVLALSQSDNEKVQAKALAVMQQMPKVNSRRRWHRSQASSSSSSSDSKHAGASAKPARLFTPQRSAEVGIHRRGRRDAVSGTDQEALVVAVRRLSLDETDQAEHDSSDGVEEAQLSANSSVPSRRKPGAGKKE